MNKINCKECGKTSYKRIKRVMFCSRECYYKWMNKNPHKVAYRKFSMCDGYKLIYMPTHPYAVKRKKYVAEHRLVMESIIGRYLKPTELVHHKNGNRSDNKKSNLKLLNRSKHIKLHKKNSPRDNKGRFIKQ